MFICLCWFSEIVTEGNDIIRIDGLERLPSLTELNLNQNKIKKIDPTSFASLSSLYVLHLEDNILRGLPSFQNFSQLQKIFLGANRITNLSDIDTLTSFPFLIELNLIGSHAVC